MHKLIIKTLSAIFSLFLLLGFSGCTQAYTQHTEPTGGYQFTYPDDWNIVEPTVDIQEWNTTNILTGPTAVAIPKINTESPIINAFVINGGGNAQEAIEKFIIGADYDGATVIKSTPYTLYKTKLPATLITIKSDIYITEYITYALGSNKYAVLLLPKSEDVSKEIPDRKIQRQIEKGMKKIITTFDLYSKK